MNKVQNSRNDELTLNLQALANGWMSNLSPNASLQSDPELDYYGWLSQQARALRTKDTASVDWTNLAEEIDAMAKRERRELRSRLKNLFAHLLKWKFEVEHRSSSWKGSITLARQEISELLDDSPSLRGYLTDFIPPEYEKARQLASDETGLQLNDFPQSCPWDFTKFIRRDFWPEPRRN